MSFSTPPLPKTLNVPIQPEQLSSNQQTVPVPMWWGRRKVAMRWITPAMNQKSVQANDVPSKK
jgi:hypothetical protein